MRFEEALEIPRIVHNDDFIARLTDGPEKVKELLRQFVVPDNLYDKLDALLAKAGQRLDDGRDMGRFVYGSFGSGKSHLMTVLGKMLERDEGVYAEGDPALGRLRAAHPWLDRQRALVVRLNMMGKDSLVRGLYESYRAALPPGAPPITFTSVDQVFDLVDRDAERLGGRDALLRRLVGDGVLRSEESWAERRGGTVGQQLTLAAELLTWRNHGQEVDEAALWVDEAEGFARISRHAADQGYTTVVWLIDELIIWIREKAREEYVRQINALSALVDVDGKVPRALPFLVLVAVQQDITETCPQDLSEADFRRQLGFVSDRFKPFLMLEEQDLYDVAKRRVLRPRADAEAAWGQAVERAFARHGDAIRALSGDLDLAEVRALYPFHPALLRVLVDVTQALSRSRTAMAALYGLLDKHREREVGQTLPLGALWELLFTPDQVATARQREKSELAGRLAQSAEVWEALAGKVEDAAHRGGERPEVLAGLVKSVLLCQLSWKPYFTSGKPLRESVTASLVLRLNASEVHTVVERSGVTKVARLFGELATLSGGRVKALGEPDPAISIRTDRFDLGRVMEPPKSGLTHADRFAVVRRLVDEQLGLGLGTANEAATRITWRGTQRRGRVRLANVRTLRYAGAENDFAAGDADFLVLVDYPFDEESGKGRADDQEALQRARDRRRQWTVAWLPEHFRDTELAALANVAAAEKIKGNPRHWLAEHSPRDVPEILREVELFAASQQLRVEEAISRAYFDGGLVAGCSELLDQVRLVGKDRSRALTALGQEILDARFPQHPELKRLVRPAELARLAEWVIRAAKTEQAVELRGEDRQTAEALGLPLEVVYVGQSSVTHRLDGRFLTAARRVVGERTRLQAAEVVRVLAGEGKDGFGFTDEVCRFFLMILLHIDGFEARSRGASLTVDELKVLPLDFELVKADVVGAVEWERATRTATSLLGVQHKVDLPTSPAQDKLAREVKAAAARLLEPVVAHRERVVATCAWAGVEAAGSERVRGLRALEDTLRELAAAGEPADRTRRLARLDDGAVRRWTATLGGLGAEAQGLEAIGHGKATFETVRDHGTEAERSQVVVALQNLLRDERALATYGKPWKDEADRLLRGVLARLDAERRRQEEVRGKQEAERLRLADERRRIEREGAERAAEAERAAQAVREAEARRAEAERAAAEADARRLEAERLRAATEQETPGGGRFVRTAAAVAARDVPARAMELARDAAREAGGGEYEVIVTLVRGGAS
ncbi:MAG: hypothetical protein AMXMBFR64_07210 [Myxococcales bacterium]